MHPDNPDLDQSGDEQRNSTSSDTSGGQSENWKERFNGLNRTHQKIVESLDTYKKRWAEKNEELEAERAEKQRLQQQIDAFKAGQQQQVTAWETERSQLATQGAATQRELTIAKLLMDPNSGFQSLQPFFARGTLRTDGLEGDTLIKYLTDFKADIESVAGAAADRAFQGATPAPPANGGDSAVETSEALCDRLSNMSPGDKDWDNTFSRYTKSLAKKK